MITLEDIENDAFSLIRQTTDTGMFDSRTCNEWIEFSRKHPTPKMLFGEFWFEQELCILFADTNLGKSILAVQLGDSISKGKAINGFKFEACKQPVLYFDFELSYKQFEVRYTDSHGIRHVFDDGFRRIELNADAVIPHSITFEEYLSQSMESVIKASGAKVLIIDNITYLRSETERAKDALPLMKHLKELKKRHGLSILALAHTPKRDSLKPLSKNDLQGSKMLINFCDSAFAIGESRSNKAFRYLKQIKQRNTELRYDSDNVCVCEICKPHCFLGFEFVTYSAEHEHLQQPDEFDREGRNEQIVKLFNDGRRLREIARTMSMSHTAVGNIINKQKKI